MSHLVTVKESNLSVPGRGIVPDETTLLVDQRQLDRFAKGPLFTSGKLEYGGPGVLLDAQADLTALDTDESVVRGFEVTYSGTVTAIGLLHIVAPTVTALDLTLGVAVGANDSTYVAPSARAQATFVEDDYPNLIQWRQIAPVKFRAGQIVLVEVVDATAPFTAGAGFVALTIQDSQNAYSAYS